MLSYNPPRYLFRRHAILKFAQPSSGFLEIGAGNLKLAEALLDKFKRGTVVDFTPNFKDIHTSLKPSIKKRLSLLPNDFMDSVVKDKFDCVVACEVMEHVREDTKFLKKLIKATKPGGQLLVTVPAKMKYWTIHDEIVGHYKRYEKDELVDIFAANGCKNIKIISYGYPFVNLLWFLRKFHGTIQARSKKNWTKKRQTQESGTNQIGKWFNVFAIITSKYVFYIPNKISELFYDFDLSEAYLIVANKK